MKYTYKTQGTCSSHIELEIEDNMKFNIHEIIFRLHLEKQSYDKAVNDIKNVFNLMRIQFQRVQEAMRKSEYNYGYKEKISGI